MMLCGYMSYLLWMKAEARKSIGSWAKIEKEKRQIQRRNARGGDDR